MLIGSLLSLVLAPSAWAGTIAVSRVGNVVTVQTSSPTANEWLRMSITGGELLFNNQQFTDADGVAPCSEDSAGDVRCPDGAGVARIVIRSGGGDDDFDTQFSNGDLQALIDADMGPGDDILSVGDNSQRVTALGGEGSDSMFAGPAVDRLEGGPGNDGIDGGLGSDECSAAPTSTARPTAGIPPTSCLTLTTSATTATPRSGKPTCCSTSRASRAAAATT